MTALRTAAQQALEAWDTRAGIDTASRAFEALRAALAQEQAEPVAWLYEAGTDRTLHWHKPPLCGTPLYTAPPRCPNCTSLEAQNTELDRKLAELEQAEPVQEPVAWRHKGAGRFTVTPLVSKFPEWEPLYTDPPKRQPLSGLEVERLLEQVIGSLPAARNLVRAVERAHGIVTCGDTKERA